MDEVDTSLTDTIKALEELNKSKERGEKRAYALRLCVFVTVIGYIASIVSEASRVGSAYTVLSSLGKEFCSFVLTNETNGG